MADTTPDILKSYGTNDVMKEVGGLLNGRRHFQQNEDDSCRSFRQTDLYDQCDDMLEDL